MRLSSLGLAAGIGITEDRSRDIRHPDSTHFPRVADREGDYGRRLLLGFALPMTTGYNGPHS